MKYSIQIFWGASFSHLQKNEVRNSLKQALISLNLLPCWNEIILKGNIVDRIFRMNLTRIIVNKHQICTIANDSNIPNYKKYAELIEHYRKANKIRPIIHSVMNAMAGFVIAVIPKCPVCWATYMSMFGFMGVSIIPYSSTIFFAMLILALANLLYTIVRVLKAKNYFPVIFMVLGYALIFSNRNIFENKILIYLGIILLIISSVSNHFRFQNLIFKLK